MRKSHGRFLGQDLMKGENPNIHVGTTRRQADGQVKDVQQGSDRVKRGTSLGPDAPLGEVAAHNDFDVAQPPKFTPLLAQNNPQQPDGDNKGTSIFDPVLCELAYRWFSPAGGRILDPFAGGSVRGIVASRLGLNYLGIELRAEQIAANEEQARGICRDGEPWPRYRCGDAREELDKIPEGKADLIFTCPPYGSLEIYSDDPRDISGMELEDFDEAMRIIILKATRGLARDRFSIWICSDYRLKDGRYACFPSKIREWHADAGLSLYNEAILINAAGSLPIRAGKQFEATRKLGRMHQEILIFLKGDGRRATAACAPIDGSALDAAIEGQAFKAG